MFSSNTSQVSGGGYQISRSLRFNKPDAATLTRTPASASNQKTWTWSGWIKRGRLGIDTWFFSSGTDASNVTLIRFVSNDVLRIYTYDINTLTSQYLDTTAVFRDPSAWYHIVAIHDTTQVTAADRLKLYVNGVQQVGTTTGAVPQNSNGVVNSTNQHFFGPTSIYAGSEFDGYMTEVNFIDGQALTPSSFGETNAQTGVWQPKAYAGTYGTNGFYLNFSDNSNTTAATLGKDYSGNGNNWTPNNFSVTAGAGNDSLVDVPTNWGADTGAGGTVRGNYCTLNPLIQRWLIPTATFSNGNLDTANTNASNAYVFGTTSVNSGKFYWEVTVTAVGSSAAAFSIGVDSGAAQFSTFPDIVAYGGDGNKYVGSTTPSSYGASYTTNDIIGVALDKDAGTVTFYKNGTSQGAISLPTNVAMVSYCTPGITSGSATFNFGQRPFAYTAPSGFKALCTQNLPTPAIGATTATQANKYFDVVLRNGGGSSGGTYSTTVNMSNGALLWDKPRNQASSNYLVDSVRGISKNLISNQTAAESTDNTWFTNFGSSAFTTGATDWGTGTTVVDWIWAANGSGSSNTAGSITSTVSANTTSGFSIATWTGTGSGTATIGHGLGVAPSMIILKFRNTTSNWSIYHASLGNTKRLTFTTAAEETDSTIWNNTSPTSTVFTTGTALNQSFTYVAYCFAAVAGYNAFGSYTGNGSTDGPFVFTGFRPAYLLIKSSTSAGSAWGIYDVVRSTFNVVGNVLQAQASDAEVTGISGMDILSNGFKLRDTNSSRNASGETYIYAAFASTPFKYSIAR